MSDAEIFEVSIRPYELRLDWPALFRKSEKADEIQRQATRSEWYFMVMGNYDYKFIINKWYFSYLYLFNRFHNWGCVVTCEPITSMCPSRTGRR